MSCRTLQGNHLYRRIEHRNIFQTFSKSYKKRSLNRLQPDRSKINNLIQQTTSSVNQTADNSINTRQLLNRNDSTSLNTQRMQSELSFPVNIHQKYSTKLLPAPYEAQSKTTPVEYQMPVLQRNRDCVSNLSSKTQNSESSLLKWNQRRKNEDFKLKSCLQKDKIHYQTMIDQADFSTLQMRKRSEILNRRDQRYHQKWKLGMLRQQNKNTMSQAEHSFANTKKNAFILSKYSKFSEEGLRNHLLLLTRHRK